MIRAIALRLAALPLAVMLVGASPKLRVGDIAPEGEFTLVSGEKVAISALRGQVVVINFWATWCVPCRKELPTLDAFYRLTKQHGLRVFAVTTEDSVPIYAMKKVFDTMAISPVKRVKGPYFSLGAVPTNFIIDRAGRVRYAKTGAFDLDDLNREVVPLLNEPAPEAPAL
ncbi:MAG: TlpA family protein disulfide reductase [Sphingomonas sp.]|jgi:cytochrome c biogenesis protein CcmG, thiol:disulfide interchange protein DsbE|uniref:TlpA family protein disulfide reductase n=1 Tax=Sphingomonas sp. TaxID=28214 RepID=UPI000A0E8285|nr:TlpA disulfide reductase family protein [Sphingomonas sp.]MBX9881125.1 TlpA family protein disulfide reductase [Sphingomonas sp.]OQW45303.1 MAG: thiol:disulfide interchange protein [Proteobacteria bacterium SG_bin6]